MRRFRSWMLWGLVACAVVAARWLLPHVTVCHPESLTFRELTGTDGQTVRVRPANTLTMFEIDGATARWHVYQDDFGFTEEGKLDTNGRVLKNGWRGFAADGPTPNGMRLQTNRWGHPVSLHIEDTACLPSLGMCQSMGTASFEIPLHCGPRPRWALEGRTALDYVAWVIFVEPPGLAVALGLLVGLFFSIVEARAAGCFPRGILWATAALAARVLLSSAAAGFCFEMLDGWTEDALWHYDYGLDFGRQPFVLLRMGCFGLGQILAATAVAFWREDFPRGALRAAPPVSVLLILTALFGFVLQVRVDPSLGRPNEVSPLMMLSTWGLIYGCAPVLLWALIPRRPRRYLRLTGLALMFFVLGQSTERWDTLIQLLNVLRGPGFWMNTSGDKTLSLDEIFSWSSLGLVLGGLALLVIVATHQRADAAVPAKTRPGA